MSYGAMRMKRRTRKSSKWTFLVIPGADRKVMQTRITIRALLLSAVLLFILVGAAGLWLYLNLTGAEKQIDRLTRRLAEQRQTAAEMEAAATKTIRRLQQEMGELDGKARQVEAKLSELERLERQIREIAGAGDQTGEADGSGAAGSGDRGGPYISGDRLDDRLNELSARIDDVRGSLRDLEHVLRQTPSIWPVHTRTITSRFGLRRDPFTRKSAFHNGIDIDGARGDPVYSTADGKVLEQGRDPVLGNYIIIEHTEDIQTAYLHLLDIAVRNGERVEKGQQIGRVGSTGRSTGPHLHYEVRIDGEPVDPEPYLSLYSNERTEK